MSDYGYSLVQGAQYTSKDSVSSTGATKIHTISSNQSSEVRATVLTGHLEVNTSADGGRLHIRDGSSGTKLDTFSLENTGYKRMPSYPPKAMRGSAGNDLYLDVDGASAIEAVVTVVVAEEY